MACGCGPHSCKDFDDDREGVDEADLARFGGDDITCPECKASVYHDAPLCHKCGHAMTRDDGHAPAKINVPVIAGLVLVGVAVAYFLWLR
jgi:uncharacterized protein (DUF983 family)